MRVFINYRRSDSAAYAGRLFDNLQHALGNNAVFRDIDSIDIGTDFEGVIEHSLSNCNAVIVMIGPTWAATADETGRPRLSDEHDYVRMEIEHALERGVQVVPVLVGGASMPSPRDLPDGLESLTRQNALTLTDQHWAADVTTLVDALTRAHGVRGRRRFLVLVVGALVAAAIVALVVAELAGAFSSTSSPGGVASVLPRDVKASRDCEAKPLPPDAGIKQYSVCTVPGLPGAGLFVGIYDDVRIGLDATNETYRFDPTKAAKSCPPGASSTSGVEALAEPAGAVLECMTSPVTPPVYIYTVPARNAVLVVIGSAAEKATNLDAWFHAYVR